PESALSARLRAVQRELREAIDASPPEPVRLVSVCAGQGHDVVGALHGHPRCGDVNATLIELDDQNLRAARERAGAAGLTNVDVIEGRCSHDTHTPGMRAGRNSPRVRATRQSDTTLSTIFVARRGAGTNHHD